MRNYLLIICFGFLLLSCFGGPFIKGNAKEYSVSQTEVLSESPLSGKTLVFLGSSVTLGFASHQESFVDYIQKRNGSNCVKEAKSGTTLLDNGSSSYLSRMLLLDPKTKVDVFVCQLSTNDTRRYGLEKLGEISSSKDRNDFDKTTTLGSIEYIISYAKQTWNCPVVFYTNSYFGDKNYEVLIEKLYEIKIKWGIEIIDLYNDKELNNLSEKQLRLYMKKDKVHPLRAGYKLWWTPVFEKRLYEIIETSNKEKELTYKTKMTEINFRLARNYFVKNNVGNLSNLVIRNDEKFNEIFSMATVMGKQGRPTEIDFSKELVLAVILPETDFETSVMPVSVQKGENGKITLIYQKVVGQKQSYVSKPSFIVVLENEDILDIEFVEL